MFSHLKVDTCFKDPFWACCDRNFHFSTLSKPQNVDIILKTIERIAQLCFKQLRANPSVGSSSLPATTSFDREQSKYEMVMWREIDLNVFVREYGWYGG